VPPHGRGASRCNRLSQPSTCEPTDDPLGDRLPPGLEHHVVAHVGEDFRLGAVCAGGRACFRHGEASIVACGPEPAWGANSVWTCPGKQPRGLLVGTPPRPGRHSGEHRLRGSRRVELLANTRRGRSDEGQCPAGQQREQYGRWRVVGLEVPRVSLATDTAGPLPRLSCSRMNC